MALYRFAFPTTIHFGMGARRLVVSCLESYQLKRPLVVTDRGLASLQLIEEMMDVLAKGGLAPSCFSNVWGNPVKSQVAAGVGAFRSHHADCIVGIGGGAALDVAKAVALMASHSGDLFDYEDGVQHARPIEDRIPYWVALPTTSGTGSEVGRSTVISDDTTHAKKIIFSPLLLAKVVFADPELTVDLPPKVTAATGMDALTHCVESFLAKGYHPICDGVALEGLRLAALHLTSCYSSPRDLEARGAMMMASMMGAIAFQKGLGLTHSCAHALSTAVDLHHGLANGIMIPYALRFNATAVPDRFSRLAQIVGLSEHSASAFLNWLRDLRSKIGIPERLTDVGVRGDQVDRLSELALQDGCHLNNPRPCTLDDFRRIFTESMG